ncbi:hypothetical protein SAMN05216605_12231 [Pseudomonas abietaniphila]|uniref:Uncharacterized protein n=1 Tax=Pseudomonas abietaniphila TaxID=89065 RepID=A0A1G8RCN5_9PSED|nr:hypothetical protein SAMN05216605_12231 [Pseudomonas abietaniphila]
MPLWAFQGFKPVVSVRFLRVAKPDSIRHIPDDAERHWMCYHAERGNNQQSKERKARSGF